ncbi:MAG: prepilin-type N-terminal cleavage/methylation domain-containing protein [Verrucomicrobiae bacterium]|nr:prepilin-type N-terminal cleavage/methylation domain-containing protein [Verrucomicrobiae bacterium]MCP5522810.1 prepilin-type N-terminal cleavage/methylation domain-containing protein [Verrucomicrobiales bacterium]
MTRHGLQRCLQRRLAAGAFTLFELMVVIAILGIVATISMPALLSNLKKGPMREAVENLQEVCRHARLKAVMEGHTAELIIRAGNGALDVRRAEDTDAPDAADALDPSTVSDAGTEAAGIVRAGKVQDLHLRLPESVAFKELRVNLRDMMDFPEARVRFYPDGTCDALETVLFSERSEERRLKLEITTGRDIVEVIR